MKNYLRIEQLARAARTIEAMAEYAAQPDSTGLRIVAGTERLGGGANAPETAVIALCAETRVAVADALDRIAEAMRVELRSMPFGDE